MEKHIPYHMKGKGIDGGFSPPPRRRVRAPEIDTAPLIEANSLTLMGRLTNPSAQRLWSMFPFLSNRWNLKGKASGSDLGRGCFQFCFDYEEDLQRVLDNYHYDQWMVILKKWEPVISEDFPSLIPFWIEVQGLPKHFWQPEMLRTIGEDFGEVTEIDISNSSSKFKVTIDGLKPLVKETLVEFRDGSEALISLEYKNLKNHCSYCLRLSHEKKDCPGLKEEKEEAPSNSAAPLPGQKSVTRNYYSPLDNFAAPSRANSLPTKGVSSNDTSRHLSRQADLNRSNKHFCSFSTNHQSVSHRTLEADRHRNPSDNSGHRSKSSSRYSPRPYASNRRDLTRDLRDSSRPNFSQNNLELQWREKTTFRVSPRLDSSDSSRPRRPPLERLDLSSEVPSRLPSPPPVPTTDDIMGDLREVTLQYVSCADPTESAARRRHVIQGEERGLMAETASNMLEAARSLNPTYKLSEEAPQQFVDRDNQDLPVHPAAIPSPSVAPAKKKRGRPPLNKSQGKNPVLLTGAKSSKRN